MGELHKTRRDETTEPAMGSEEGSRFRPVAPPNEDAEGHAIRGSWKAVPDADGAGPVEAYRINKFGDSPDSAGHVTREPGELADDTSA